jgi:hypothetical protein
LLIVMALPLPAMPVVAATTNNPKISLRTMGRSSTLPGMNR